MARIDEFSRQGERLGQLTQGASAFAIRPGAGGRFAAVPVQIPAQEAVRDRGVVQRLFASHNIGRQMTLQRRQLRGPNLPRRNQRGNPRQDVPQQQTPPGQKSGGPQPSNPNTDANPQQKGTPQRGGTLQERLKKLNPFAPKKTDPPILPR